jgi:invasion protein IalB
MHPTVGRGERRRNRARQGLAAALLAPLLLSPAFAAKDKEDAKKPTEKTFQDWTLVCQKPEGADKDVCVLVQQLVRKEKEGEGQQRVMLIEVGYAPKGDQSLIIFTLPLGISLPQGLSLQVDEGEARRFPVELCLRDGCRAVLPLADETLSSFKSGSQGKVTFHDPNRNPITLPVSLKGFTAGYKALGESRK